MNIKISNIVGIGCAAMLLSAIAFQAYGLIAFRIFPTSLQGFQSNHKYLRKLLRGHSDTVWSVAISPDGKSLASSSQDKTIRLWNLEELKEIRVLRGHEFGVRAVEFSPDGEKLISSDLSKEIKIWDVDSGKEIKTLSGYDGQVSTLSVSDNGQMLASGTFDNVVIWNIETGRIKCTLNHDGAGFDKVVILDDNRTMVGAGRESNFVWDLQKCSKVSELAKTVTQMKTEDILKGSYKADNIDISLKSGEDNILYSNGNNIEEMNLETGKTEKIISTNSNENLISMALSSNGEILVSGGSNGCIRIWSLENRKSLYKFSSLYGEAWDVAISADGETAISAGADKVIRVFDLSKLKS